MASFRANYLPDLRDYQAWAASPGLAPDEFFRGPFPTTHIMAMGEDLLEPEATEFGCRLRKFGHAVTVTRYVGLPHQAFSMSKLFPEILEDLEAALRHDFGAGVHPPPTAIVEAYIKTIRSV